MNATDVLAALGIPDAAEVLTPHWEESVSTLTELPRFLVPGNIRRAREFAGLPQEAEPALLEAARRTAASPELRLLAWHCHRLLYEHLDYPGWTNIRQWPHPLAVFGDLSGAFYLLIGLEVVPRTQALHQHLDIPPEVTSANCRAHLSTWMAAYREHHGGHFGIRPRHLYWLRNYTVGDLFRLGRHEYMVKPFRGPLAYRNRRTRAVVALATDGTGFDDAGLIPHEQARATWDAELRETDHDITGSPISPRGHTERRQVTLSFREWEPALAPGDGVLEMHIPAGGDMTPERCRDSMQQAIEFFSRTFPDRSFVGFACGSWILNPHLETIYRPDSNMVLWQRELYLYPSRSSNRFGLSFVFGHDDVDVATAPRDTSLRRALLDHVVSGGDLIGGGMFMLLEDFEFFGEQIYRRRVGPAD